MSRMNENTVVSKKNMKWYVLIFIAIIFVTVCIPFLFYRKMNLDINHILYFNVFLVVASFTIMLLIGIYSKQFFFQTFSLQKILSFFLIYTLCILCSCLFSFLPAMSWAFIPMAILVLFFSNEFIALVTTYSCLFISVFLTSSSYEIQILYTSSILLTVVVFSQVKKHTQYYVASCISLCIHFSFLFAYHILFFEGPLKDDTILFLILNFIINTITLIFVLGVSDIFIVRKYHNVYSQINDQEFILMKELKEKQPKAYFHAIHCAYFCDKISPKLNLDTYLVKAGAYYKSINMISEDKGKNSLQDICKQNKFPKPVRILLEELNSLDQSSSLSKEASLIKITDEIILMVERVFKKNKNVELDIEQLIDAIAMDWFSRKKLKNFKLDFYELEIIINFFKEEKLYYDFLR